MHPQYALRRNSGKEEGQDRVVDIVEHYRHELMVSGSNSLF